MLKQKKILHFRLIAQKLDLNLLIGHNYGNLPSLSFFFNLFLSLVTFCQCRFESWDLASVHFQKVLNFFIKSNKSKTRRNREGLVDFLN